MRVILAVILTAAGCFAQSYTQRGFLETRGAFYPREAVNDSAHAVGEALFRYEGFYRPSQAFQIAGAVDFRTDTPVGCSGANGWTGSPAATPLPKSPSPGTERPG